MNSTITKQTAETIRIKVALSISISFSRFNLIQQVLIKRFEHHDHRRPQGNQEQRWENEQYQRKHQLDRRFRGPLLGLLASLGAQCFRVNAQCFSNTGTKS